MADVVIVISAVVVLLVAACAVTPTATPDARQSPDGPSCPSGVVTWRDALVFWDGVRCDAMARCFPSDFRDWYGDRAGCLTQLGALHCIGGTPSNWCDLDYPRERCGVLQACQAEASALACDRRALVPDSCEDALR